jgi:hypothetical protein
MAKLFVFVIGVRSILGDLSMTIRVEIFRWLAKVGVVEVAILNINACIGQAHYLTTAIKTNVR